MTAGTAAAREPVAFPTRPRLHTLATPVAPAVGAPVAVAIACVYGLPTHTVVGMFVLAYATGFGVTLGFHRLFAHRSFATSRHVERALMVLGCAAGQSSPFFWIATHRRHHRHSDGEGDPHSPHTADGRPPTGFRGSGTPIRGGCGVGGSATRPPPSATSPAGPTWPGSTATGSSGTRPGCSSPPPSGSRSAARPTTR